MSELTLETANNLTNKSASLICQETGDTIEAKVSEIIVAQSNGKDWECFSVLLDLGENPPEFNQGIYSFDSSDYKNEHIFISPNSHTECEIVVSRKLKKD